MFLERHRRQLPRHQHRGSSQRRQNQKPTLNREIMNQLKDQHGQYECTRISETISQMNKIDDDMSPMIRKFKKE